MSSQSQIPPQNPLQKQDDRVHGQEKNYQQYYQNIDAPNATKLPFHGGASNATTPVIDPSTTLWQPTLTISENNPQANSSARYMKKKTAFLLASTDSDSAFSDAPTQRPIIPALQPVKQFTQITGSPVDEPTSASSDPGVFAARPVTPDSAFTATNVVDWQREDIQGANQSNGSTDIHVTTPGRKIISDYEIMGELGRGVYGKVKLGRNVKTGEKVAIKILDRISKKRRLGRSSNQEEKIKREIAILKKARHENIVSLIEVIDDPQFKKVYIVLEYAEIGEVQWRADGEPEICKVEYRRYLREMQDNLNDPTALKEDHEIIHAAFEKREKTEKEARERELKATGPWSLEFQQDSGRNSAAASAFHLRNLDTTDTTGSPFRTADFDQFQHLGRFNLPGVGLDEENPLDFVPEHFAYVPIMTLREIRIAFRDVLLGLQYLHYQGVIHRDIKPANLLKTKNQRIKISDFGVSYLGKTATESSIDHESGTRPAQDVDIVAVELAKTVGTPAFYAPELVLEDTDYPVSHQIDVWSLGVTLYCFIYGRVPCHDENTIRLIGQIGQEDVFIPSLRLKPLTEIATNDEKRSKYELQHEEVPAALRDLLRKLLIIDPRKRIKLSEAKEHSWLLDDISQPAKWIAESDPSKQLQGKKIQVSKEDVESAVQVNNVNKVVTSIFSKITGAIGIGSSNRPRAKSAATQLPSASSSPQLAQRARPTDLVLSALKASRPLQSDSSRSPSLVTASPSIKTSPLSLSGHRNYEYSSNLTSPDRPVDSEREKSVTGSIKTVRPSDFFPKHRPEALVLPTSAQPLEHPTTPLLGFIGGLKHRIVQGVASFGAEVSRMASPGGRLTFEDESYSSPSLAINKSTATGIFNQPPSLHNSSADTSTNTSTPSSSRAQSAAGYRDLDSSALRRPFLQSADGAKQLRPFTPYYSGQEKANVAKNEGHGHQASTSTYHPFGQQQQQPSAVAHLPLELSDGPPHTALSHSASEISLPSNLSVGSSVFDKTVATSSLSFQNLHEDKAEQADIIIADKHLMSNDSDDGGITMAKRPKRNDLAENNRQP